jgi:hypothetical protein
MDRSISIFSTYGKRNYIVRDVSPTVNLNQTKVGNMKVQPKGTATIVKRGRPPFSDANIEQALRLLKKTTDEIVLSDIRVTQSNHTQKMKYRNRIHTISMRLGKPVSISWTVGAKSSPVVSKANR